MLLLGRRHFFVLLTDYQSIYNRIKGYEKQEPFGLMKNDIKRGIHSQHMWPKLIGSKFEIHVCMSKVQ